MWCIPLGNAEHVKVYETMDEFYAWQNAQTPYYVSTVEPAIAAVDNPTEEEAEEDKLPLKWQKPETIWQI